jgi:hypothetical protein
MKTITKEYIKESHPLTQIPSQSKKENKKKCFFRVVPPSSCTKKSYIKILKDGGPVFEGVRG